VLDPIIDKFDLLKEYRDDYYYQARKELASRTSVDTNRKSGVITITVTGGSQREAQMMAQEYATQLDRVVRSVSNSDAHRERIFLESRLRAVKTELDAASRRLADFATKNSALDIPEQARASVMTNARAQAEMVALQAQLEGLRQIYTDNNSRVQALQRQIAELRRQTDVQQTGDVAPDSMMSWMKKLPQLGVQWAEYYRTATVDEVIYEALTKQYEIAKVQEAKETTSVSVLDAPSWPERKSFPKGSIFLPVGLLLSLVLGCGYILSRDAYQRIDPTHPAKIYIEDTRARLMSRWENNRLRMKVANRRLKSPEDNGSIS
jgi:capsule polysaccharide export protein KpsE/RkpR